MKTELKIAWRYLFAKKQYNAIHIISGISAAAIGVVTAAMICVLSVMNGFGVMVEQLFSQFDPDIRIEAVSGKSFHDEGEQFDALRQLPAVALVSQTIEETALLQFEDRQMPVRLCGVDSIFPTLTHIQDIITDGEYSCSASELSECIKDKLDIDIPANMIKKNLVRYHEQLSKIGLRFESVRTNAQRILKFTLNDEEILIIDDGSSTPDKKPKIFVSDTVTAHWIPEEMVSYEEAGTA